ncbi:MAG: hypothetical protein ACOH5I_11990 [Oligoflexus sp.]
MYCIIRILFMLFTFVVSLSTNAHENVQILEFDKIDHAQISIEREIFGVMRDKDRIWLLPKFGGFLIESRYNASAKDSEAAFYMQGRDTAQSWRHHLPEEVSDSFWRGIIRLDEYLMVFDPYRRRFLTFNAEKKEWGVARDLVLDLLSPPADRRGLPPQRETQNLRARFLQSYKKMAKQPEIFTDVAVLPESWRKHIGNSQMIVASRIPGFSIIGMKCDLGGMGYCQFQQSCFVEPESKLHAPGLTGVAVSEKRKQILVGDFIKQEINIFHFETCYHIRYLHTLRLPPQLKAITAIDVDAEDNLWISTEEPDPYKNASVYRWSAKNW